MAEKVRILWQPNQDVIRSSNILRFVNWLDEVFSFGFEVSVDDPLRNVGNYDRLWRWSVEDLEGFWVSVWRYFGVVSHSPYTKVLEPRTMPGARWFIGSRLNYAEHVFKAARWGGEEAVVYVREDGLRRSLTWDQLYREVAALADWLRSVGVNRVIGLPHTLARSRRLWLPYWLRRVLGLFGLVLVLNWLRGLRLIDSTCFNPRC